MNNFICSCFSMPCDTKLLRWLCSGKNVGKVVSSKLIYKLHHCCNQDKSVLVCFQWVSLCLQCFVDFFSGFFFIFFIFLLFLFCFLFCSFVCLFSWEVFGYCCCCCFLQFCFFYTKQFIGVFNLAAYFFSNNVQNLFLNGKPFLKWYYIIHRKIDKCSFHVNVITFFFR